MQLSLPTAIAKPLASMGLVNAVSGYADEGAGQPPVTVVQLSAMGSVISFLHTLMCIFALMLMFQRNDGFSLGGFLAACCCTSCYLAYALADPKGKQKIHF